MTQVEPNLLVTKYVNNNRNTYDNIKTSDIDTVISRFLPSYNQFDVAILLYKLCYDKYSCKSFSPNIWISKVDSKIPSKIVKESILNDIKTSVKNVLVDYNSKLHVESKEYKNINYIIQKISSSKNYVKDIIRESNDLFYNN
jgi:hypothetical protein